jgi:hypothetical protein
MAGKRAPPPNPLKREEGKLRMDENRVPGKIFGYNRRNNGKLQKGKYVGSL